MAYWVEIIRREVNYERYAVRVEAGSPDEAEQRVREHYTGDGNVLTDEERASEFHDEHMHNVEDEITEINCIYEVS